MTLTDLLPSLPLTYDEGRKVGLLFGRDLAERLEAVQREASSRCLAVPLPTADGRYLLCGDILSEVGPGGLFAAGFARFGAAETGKVEVVGWAIAVAMIAAEACLDG